MNSGASRSPETPTTSHLFGWVRVCSTFRSHWKALKGNTKIASRSQMYDGKGESYEEASHQHVRSAHLVRTSSVYSSAHRPLPSLSPAIRKVVFGGQVTDEETQSFRKTAGTSLAVSATLLAFVSIGRAAFVFPLANIANCLKKREGSKLPFCNQFIIWWAGLMRGAVTIALSYNQFSDSDESTEAENSPMITSTIIVFLFSIVHKRFSGQ